MLIKNVKIITNDCTEENSILSNELLIVFILILGGFKTNRNIVCIFFNTSMLSLQGSQVTLHKKAVFHNHNMEKEKWARTVQWPQSSECCSALTFLLIKENVDQKGPHLCRFLRMPYANLTIVFLKHTYTHTHPLPPSLLAWLKKM